MAAPSTRRRAREVAFRVAYQADVVREPVEVAWRTAAEAERLAPDPQALAEDLVRALCQRLAEIDTLIREATQHWELERLAATDRAVLRVAIAELLGRPRTPARVVLDEAIEIARRYGAEESARFVNGVLDHIARRIRPGEM